MDYNEILKYVSGNCNEPEAEAVRKLIATDPEAKKEFIRLKNLYALSGDETQKLNIDSDFHQLSQKIGFRKSRLISLTRELLKYAAVAAVAITASWFLFGRDIKTNTQVVSAVWNEIIVPKGQMSEFVFGDGTHIWINSGSTLRFPQGDLKEIREAFIEGEAYFEVAKNTTKPFFVRTANLDVKVVGTSFNVQAYPDMVNLETTLVEGKVEIIGKNQAKLADLNPGESLKYSKSENKGKIEVVETSGYYAWRDGKMVFKNKPLDEIALQLERWYNVKIIFANDEIKEFRFTGTILKNKPFDQVLQAIKLTVPIRYDIKIKADSINEITLYSMK